MEMLFCTSLVALVGVEGQEGFSSKQLQIINTKVSNIIYGKMEDYKRHTHTHIYTHTERERERGRERIDKEKRI